MKIRAARIAMAATRMIRTSRAMNAPSPVRNAMMSDHGDLEKFGIPGA
jgi:hypothetical protein